MSDDTPGDVVSGDYDRDTRYIETRITADGRDGYPVVPGRYRLMAGPVPVRGRTARSSSGACSGSRTCCR